MNILALKPKNWLLILWLLVVFAVPPAHAGAQSLFSGARGEACKATRTNNNATGDCTSAAGGKLGNVIEKGVNLLTIVVGIIAVIMIIIGGLRFIIAAGDSAKINSARNTVIYALVGLIIVAFAQLIVKLVLTRI